MVLSATLARSHPPAVIDYIHCSSRDLEEIRQGLKEIKEGKVKPLSQLEEEFGIGKGLS